MIAPSDEEFAERIQYECFNGDTEIAHGLADDILCELLNRLGYVKTVAAYNRVEKWYA